MCHGGNPSVMMTISKCQVRWGMLVQKRLIRPILTLKSLWKWRQDTSVEPVLIESAVLYEMAAHLVYDICRLQINNFRLLFADCKEPKINNIIITSSTIFTCSPASKKVRKKSWKRV